MAPPVGSLAALLLGTLSIAALHALIPSHWLAFALVARARGWSVRQALRVTLLAGSGHALLTVGLGLLVASAGKWLIRVIPPSAEHAAGALLLIALGVYFIVGARHGGHSDAAEERGIGSGADVVSGDADVSEEAHNAARLSQLGSEPTLMGTLVLGMTLSPCLDLLSVYVGAATLSWQALALISATMALTTLSLMALLVWLTLRGLQRVSLEWLERYEGVAVGGALIALGVLLFFL